MKRSDRYQNTQETTRRQRRGRRCGWFLTMPRGSKWWWAPSLRQWVDIEIWDRSFPVTNIRRCKTRTSALRAARGLAALGGGTLHRRVYNNAVSTVVEYTIEALSR